MSMIQNTFSLEFLLLKDIVIPPSAPSVALAQFWGSCADAITMVFIIEHVEIMNMEIIYFFPVSCAQLQTS